MRPHLGFCVAVSIIALASLVGCTQGGGLDVNGRGNGPGGLFGDGLGGNGTNGFRSAFPCSVENPTFVRWVRFQIGSQAMSLYPVFKFQIKSPNKNAFFKGLTSSPEELAYADSRDPSNVLLVPSNQNYVVSYYLGDPNIRGDARCDYTVDYQRLTANIPAPPWNNFNYVPIFIPYPKYNPGNGGGDGSLPSKLAIKGPTRIHTITCTKYEIQTLNSNNQQAAPRGYALEVELTSEGNLANLETGAFFTDSSCRTPVFTTEFASGESSKTLYYLSGTSHTATLRAKAANAPGNSSISDGVLQVQITPNPQFQVELGINFEDWTDWDYNDSVVCARNTNLVVDGNDILSYDNQWVSFDIYSGGAGCDHQIQLKLIDPDGNTRIHTEPSTHASPTVNLYFRVNTRLIVSFRSVSGCQSYSGNWNAQGSQRVKIANLCRTSAGEGHVYHW